MAYSRVVKIGDGVSTQFSVNFALDYIAQNQVTARVGTEVDGIGAPVYRAITFLSTNLLQIAGSPAGIGVQVLFERTVPKNELVIDYSDGDVMDEDNLNISQKQTIMAVHEVLDGRFATLTQDLDMGGFKVKNVGTPTSSTDVATKDYVDSGIGAILPEIVQVADIAAEVIIVAGLEDEIEAVAAIADILEENLDDISNFADVYQGSKPSNPVVRNDGSPLQTGDMYFNSVAKAMQVYDGLEWRDASSLALNLTPKNFTGDGATTAFTLDVTPAVASNVLVWVGGVRQRPVTDYTVSGTTLTILTAPANTVPIDTLVIATTTAINVPATGSVVAASISDVAADKAAIFEKIVDPWAAQPIGVPIPLFTNVTGVTAPPTNKSYRYVLLTAAQNTTGLYNDGIITSESTTGVSPEISSTGVISLSGSPLNGSTIRLINTERRFLRAGSAGTLEDSCLKSHAHSINDPGHQHGTNPQGADSAGSSTISITGSAQTRSSSAPVGLGFTGISIVATGGTETRGRNIGVNFYMRIK